MVSAAPILKGTGGWATAATSPSAIPQAMLTRAAWGDCNPDTAETSTVVAHAEAMLAQMRPTMVAQGTWRVSPNSRTRAAVSAQPAPMVVSCR